MAIVLTWRYLLPEHLDPPEATDCEHHPEDGADGLVGDVKSIMALGR